MKTIHILAVLPALLTGCVGPMKVSQLENGALEVNYTESAIVSSPALVQTHMNQAAMERCPEGYDKLKERTFKKEYMPTHVWTIRCLKGGESE